MSRWTCQSFQDGISCLRDKDITIHIGSAAQFKGTVILGKEERTRMGKYSGFCCFLLILLDTKHSRKPMICSFYRHITKDGAREAQDKLSLWPLLSGFRGRKLRVKGSLGASAGSHCCCCVLPTPSTSSAAPLTRTRVDHCPCGRCAEVFLVSAGLEALQHGNTCMIMH